jgi:EAL domain-containing protein (putative c-di-GMP-specific phosphodiesterase class I)
MTISSHHFDSSRAQARQVQMAHRLAQAIEQGQLQVHYQPEFQIDERRVVSLEALCRWHDLELNQVAPDEFIAVAEAKGLIAPLGTEILRLVLADMPHVLQRWPDARVAINVSGLELEETDFASQFLTTVDAANPVYAMHLELEVTESIFHRDLPTVRQNLEQLKARGLTIAIDDFGTGQSSLSRLHTLPFDKIKMDKSFVKGLTDPMVRAIVKGMVDLTTSFNRALVAEGVETSADLMTLREIGCTLVQGYLLSAAKPLSQLPLEFDWPRG